MDKSNDSLTITISFELAKMLTDIFDADWEENQFENVTNPALRAEYTTLFVVLLRYVIDTKRQMKAS